MIDGRAVPMRICAHVLRRQRGLTMLGFLVSLLLLGFFSLLLVKIGPIFVDHYMIRSTLESLQQDRDIHLKTREEILDLLRRRWDINNIRNVTTKDVKMTREDGVIKLHLKYDVTQSVIGNIDALVHFNDLILINPADETPRNPSGK